MTSGRLTGSDMAARLRRKFVLVAMVSVAVVLIALIGGVNVANYINIRVDADELIDLIAEYDGTIPTVVVGEFDGDELSAGDVAADALEEEGASDDGEAAEEGAADDAGADSDDAADGSESDDAADGAGSDDTADGTAPSAAEVFELFEEVHGRISAEATYETRYFTVALDAAGSAVAVDTSSIAAVTAQEAQALAEELAAAGETEGFHGNYRYRAVPYTGELAGDLATAQTMYIFVDCTTELESFDTLLQSSIVMSCVGLLLVLVLVIMLSGFVVRPIAESYEKQKRFITDASHEIKTPLSVIDAADEVVEIEYGESEWTQSIHDQVARLADLTNRLVFLSRMDEGADGFAMEELSLSQVVEQAAEPYAAVARARGKTLCCEVEPGLSCRGDSKALSQVVELLLDNALQYSSEGSEVRLVADHSGRRCRIVVQNECDQLPEGDLDRLFERFYRADSSRSSETGGSGVGLSVVRAIAEAHKGTARAERAGEHAIRFVVEL